MSALFSSTEALVQRLAGLLHAHPDRPVLVALDGRCGSGKTTLAAALSRRFPASLTLHLDDYYLPPDRRAPGWERIPCANMDLDRFRDEALLPARAGQTIAYRAWSCAQGCYQQPQLLTAQPLVLAEGSYSLHPMLADWYDLRVFVTCTPEEQTRRLQQREGSRYAAFARRWIPLEERYFAQYRIEAAADLVLDTGAQSLAEAP